MNTSLCVCLYERINLFHAMLCGAQDLTWRSARSAPYHSAVIPCSNFTVLLVLRVLVPSSQSMRELTRMLKSRGKQTDGYDVNRGKFSSRLSTHENVS